MEKGSKHEAVRSESAATRKLVQRENCSLMGGHGSSCALSHTHSFTDIVASTKTQKQTESLRLLEISQNESKTQLILSYFALKSNVNQKVAPSTSPDAISPSEEIIDMLHHSPIFGKPEMTSVLDNEANWHFMFC